MKIFVYSLFLNLGFVSFAFTEGHYRVEVPLDRLSSRTLIELVIAHKNNLSPAIKYGEYIIEEGHPIHDSGISCWTWIYRTERDSLVHPENRIECRWIYGAQKGLGVFSWRLSKTEIAPIEGSSDSLNFMFGGDEVAAMVNLLVSEQDSLIKNNLAELNGIWLSLKQDGDRFPQFICDLVHSRCLLQFHPKKSSPLNFEIGDGSLVLAEMLLQDSRFSPYLSVDWQNNISSQENLISLKQAHCEFNGAFPEREQFTLQAASFINCEFVSVEGHQGKLHLKLNETSTQRWGNSFQGYDAVKLSGSITELLYYVMREKAEANQTHMLGVDDLDIGKIYRGVTLRRHNDHVEYPELAIQCSHEIYQDSFTLLYQKYFPDVYLGRVEYFNCILKSPKKD